MSLSRELYRKNLDLVNHTSIAYQFARYAFWHFTSRCFVHRTKLSLLDTLWVVPSVLTIMLWAGRFVSLLYTRSGWT